MNLENISDDFNKWNESLLNKIKQTKDKDVVENHDEEKKSKEEEKPSANGKVCWFQIQIEITEIIKMAWKIFTFDTANS